MLWKFPLVLFRFSLLHHWLLYSKIEQTKMKRNSNIKSFSSLENTDYKVHTHIDFWYCANVHNLLRVMVLIWGCIAATNEMRLTKSKILHFYHYLNSFFFFTFSIYRSAIRKHCNCIDWMRPKKIESLKPE